MTPTAAACAESLRVLIQPGSVAELRILNAGPKRTVSGYFNDMSKMAAAADRWSGRVPAVYTTLNPVVPDLLARASNRLIENVRSTTTDRDIVRRIWLPVDFDVVRPAGISSTAEEHEAALSQARRCREFLRERGWPDPIYADSGNGAHLDYRIDLPTESTLVQRVLAFLATKFNGAGVHVDVATYNPARIWKVYGTKVCKGDSTATRPHRMSGIIECPAKLIVVTDSQLTDLVGPEPVKAKPERPYEVHQFDIDAWVDRHQHRLPPLGNKRPWNGGWKREFQYCPWSADHTTNSAYIGQLSSGAVVAGCRHNSCASKTWHDLKAVVGDNVTGSKAAARPTPTTANVSTGQQSQTQSKPTVIFQRAGIKGNVRECVLLSVRSGEYDGWFGRGRVHLVNGSSGAGKTTLMVDLLHRQRTAEMYLGHLGAGLSSLILFADRGDLSNQETLARMGLLDANLNIGYLPITSSGWESINEILEKIESQETIPAVVFIEGGDMLVEDATKAIFVTPFMRALQMIAAHYHIAIILSVGSSKSRPKEEYANRRDRSFGSEKWARMSDTILALSTPPGGDDTDTRRVLDVLHRNARAEKFDLAFSEGLLVPYTAPAEKMDAFTYWVSVRDWFTLPEAAQALKGEMSKATIYRKKEEAWKAGNLEQKIDEKTGGFLYRWRYRDGCNRSHENEDEN